MEQRPEPPPQPIAVAVVQASTGAFLIGPRDPATVLGGYWEFPGGKVESSESVAAAAIRECREETGLDVLVQRLDLRLTKCYDHGSVDLHFFRCRPSADGEPTPLDPFRWVRGSELGQFSFPAGNDDLLAMLAAETAALD